MEGCLRASWISFLYDFFKKKRSLFLFFLLVLFFFFLSFFLFIRNMQMLVLEMRSGLSSEICFYADCQDAFPAEGARFELKTFFLLDFDSKHYVFLKDRCLFLSKKYNACFFLENCISSRKVYLIENLSTGKGVGSAESSKRLVASIKNQFKNIINSV
jgi:hypothetical protein